ncbi:hypothetical protein FSP39_019180 [Pinctada imbricata]|uniref:Elongator complex protein 1 n=1 Tax=Pinctada imbricata TaxID=66713 RepID=A0AA88Y5C0_PINIB|nr:hypothetical protein FSP39_019180 [Pinctada imbricata]
MRNLELLYSVQLPPVSDIQGTLCSCVDIDTGTIYCATNTNVVGLNPKDGQVTCTVSLVDEGHLPPDGSGRVIGISYLAEQQSVCVATASGDLLLWNVLMGQVECVGTVESGITCMSWSPDDALLVITTGDKTIVMMTSEFDPITEKPLEPEEFGSGQFVTVGWGKKETQFHGSVGKQAAHVKPEEVRQALPWDDRAPHISWRGDGEFFVVSSIAIDTGARCLRVWSRECELQSTSEKLDGIEHPLAWRPSGNLIASTQRRPNKHDVVFFEKNGLRHGEFTLPFGVKDTLVKELLWNNDSSVLCVWCEDLTEKGGQQKQPHSYIQLWIMSNYHWYLKQSLHFRDEAGDRVVSVMWDPEHTYRLHLVCQNGKYLQYTWSWTTHVSQAGLVAVTDSDKVLMTPMDKMVVPPPMSAYHVECPYVSQVTFCCAGNYNDFACLLENNKVAVYKFEDDMNMERDPTVKLDAAGGGAFGVSCQTPKLQKIYNIKGLSDDQCNYPLTLSHMKWLTSDLIVFVCLNVNGDQNSVLCSAKIEDEQIVVGTQLTLEGFVYQVAANVDSGILGIQLHDGTVLRYDVVSDSVLPWETSSGEEVKFPIPCHQMAVCEIGNEEVVLGLTSRYRFYVNNTEVRLNNTEVRLNNTEVRLNNTEVRLNNTEISSNCTSFAVHSEFLLLTTLTHTVRCISRHTKVSVLPTLSDGKAHPFDESIRRVERGSRIVCVVPNDTKLVLQMPRGNLETINPRALILSAVRKYLDRQVTIVLEFSLAMSVMRKHRINMNLLYDHNPEMFLQNVDKFVKQINNVNFINLFLTDLQQEDVTRTMYTAAYNRPIVSTEHGEDTKNKIDQICDAVRHSLINFNKNKFILSILTTYVKKSTPELEAALLLVRSLRDNPSSDHIISPQEALKYLLFLVDVNEMFDVALGTYDFDLVLMVAEKSQKDPKEYIPFLNHLRRLEGPYQKYTIDKHLKRYKKALESISQCGEHFQECLTLVVDHKLYTDALDLFSPSSSQYKEVAKHYGDYLTERRKHEEAGIMYIGAEKWELAIDSFLASGNWQQVLCMAARLKYGKDNMANLSRKLAGQLRDNKRFCEASVVLEQYANDTEEAVVCLIDGGQWNEALRLMYKYQRTDFIETNLKSALVDSYDQHMETLQSMEEEFTKHKRRLTVVRVEAEKAKLEFEESGGYRNEADADLFSDTSSADGESVQSSQYSSNTRQSSVFSKSTGRSSKNRRKAEHKKWKLKEGSKYEDFALIAAMSKTITNAENMRGEISSLLQALVQFHYRKEARSLQRLFERFLSQIEKSIPEIWTDEGDSVSQPMTFGPGVTANTIAQAVQGGQKLATQEKLDPIIKNPPVLKKEIKWKLQVLEISDA